MSSSRKRRRASSDSIVPQANQRDNGASWSGKELDVWEAFREEYVESVEQLPLSLHRNFALLNEIDAQAHVLESELLPKISEYIRDRGIAQGLRGTPIEGNGQNTPSSLPCGTGSSRVIPQAILSTDCRKVFQGRAEPFHTDKLLPDISIHINELLRATEEKVNLAQATYDSIDRHVRLLDQAIREHELRSKNDPPTARNKLRPFPITGLRATRLKDSADSLGTVALSNGQRRVERNARTYVASRSQRVSGTHSPSTVNPIPSSDKDLNSNRQSTRIIKGNVTVDATENVTSWPNLISTDAGSAVVLSAVDMPIDPNEPRYCYCGQVSWGEMIACDAAGCEREWFHLGCVGLAEAPKRSKWYCDVCKENNLLGARRRG